MRRNPRAWAIGNARAPPRANWACRTGATGGSRRHAPKITEQQPMEGTERTIAAEA